MDRVDFDALIELEPEGPTLRRHHTPIPWEWPIPMTWSTPAGAVCCAVERNWFFRTASLDHSVYFRRPVHPFQWLAVETRCRSLVGNRGLAVAEVFTRGGLHALAVVQEVLIRDPDDV